MKIYLGADHRGFELKEKLKKFLEEKGYEAEDLGAFVYDVKDDYPVFAHAVAEAVKRAPTMGREQIMIVNLSGRGDKDLNTIIQQIDKVTG